jgi:N-acetylglutamate synthase-like GNAT family acetyltransferase
MDLVSDIEDHVVITDEQGVCGGGLTFQLDENNFHLLTIAVRQEERSRGIGSVLLGQILRKPWTCCKDAIFNPEKPYQVTTVARGKSRPFYERNGMTLCEFSDLVPPFTDQCDACPDVNECNGVAMSFSGLSS